MPTFDVNVRAIIRHPSSWELEISPIWEVYDTEQHRGETVVRCDTKVRFVEAADEAAAIDLAKDTAPLAIASEGHGEAAIELWCDPGIDVSPSTGINVAALPLDAKIALLRECGFTVGERDKRLNTDHPGTLMVTEISGEEELATYDLPTRDSRNGPWCIVGDDLEELVNEGVEHLDFADYENVGEKLEAMAQASAAPGPGR